MPRRLVREFSRVAAAAVLGGAAFGGAFAQATAAERIANSTLDAPLFYQLLIGEIELRGGQAGTAYEVLLDAARRTRDEALFRRAVEVALQARAGEQALSAVTAWRAALPESLDALRFQVQLLVGLNRVSEVSEPLRALLERTPAAERAAVIASLPRFFQRSGDRKQAASVLEPLLEPYLNNNETRTAASVALGRTWLASGELPRALAAAERAATDDPSSTGPVLLALDLLPTNPAAERLVTHYLQGPKAEVALRVAYVQVLAAAQRYNDAVAQLKIVTREQPTLAPPWLTLGALLVDLRQPKDAEAALQRFVQLRQGAAAAPAAADDDGDEASSSDGGLTQAWLLLAQACEQRGDFAAAEAWLRRVDNPQRALEVQSRRATLMARQGQLPAARELIRRVPERGPDDARAKLVAEAQVLREVKRWSDAHEVLAQASSRFPADADLLYEQAMVAEKLNRVDEMERTLRRVIELKPENQHAYNALGYSLADRNVRLPEARELIRKALALAPGDPFITDSLGWVEFRMGNREEAIKLLRQAYQSRPDTEIATHLGEVLWANGQRDEARRVWRDASQRDTQNEVLRETLARLKVSL